MKCASRSIERCDGAAASGRLPARERATGRLKRLAATSAAVIAALVVAVAPATADLAADIQRAVRAANLKKAKVSIHVRDTANDRVLFDLEGERPMIPASNNKLLTTGAFLHAFGPDFAFRTRMLRATDDIIVLGDGDPAFADPEMLAQVTWPGPDGTTRTGLDVEQFLTIWIDALKAEGVTSIDELIIDARIFDAVAYHPNWPKDQFKEDYCAEVWGLNFHANLLHVWPRPRAGGPADVSRIAPSAPWVVKTNNTTSRVGAQDRHNFWINRAPTENMFTFSGNVKTAATSPVPVTLHNVPVFFGQVFADRLRSAGIPVRIARVASDSDPSFTEGIPVGPEVRTPVATVLYRANTDSDNLYAESLVKRLGRAASKSPGSWRNGTAAVRHAVAERLSDPSLASTAAPDDGSGLSRENRVSAAALTAWLTSFAQDELLRAPFIDSLAVGGKTGTVRKRFREIERTGCIVQCKTGYIRGVSTLSGYVTAPDGRRIAFSVLCNELVAGDSVAQARALQEKVVAAIAEELAATKPSARAAGR
jgi:D-alanyl-D-alanine carboxypeptidase/D-alanyl-D-alanine-endopeptidase (penicillin-binding protein 4)